MYRIPLRVAGVDLEDDEILVRIDGKLDDLAWAQLDGRTLAVLHTDHHDPVAAVVNTAHRIRHFLPEATVEVDLELVNIPDVAARLGVNREAVRLWADGQRGPGHFPAPIGSVGGGARSVRIWRWSDVWTWLSGHYALGEDDVPMDSVQQVEANAALARIQMDPAVPVVAETA
jgi:hypothetical protein